MSSPYQPLFVSVIPVQLFPYVTRSKGALRCQMSHKSVRRTRPMQPPPPNQKLNRNFGSDLDSFSTFSKDINQYRLLRPDEERELTEKVARLRKLTKARESLPVDGSVEATDEAVAKFLGITLEELLSQRAEGLASRDALVAANLRLVVKIAREVLRRRVGTGTRTGHAGVSLLDLVQEGTLGLLRAADEFDPDRGVKFASFAYLCIKRCCERAVADFHLTVRVPERLLLMMKRLRGARAEFFAANGRWPSQKELSEVRPDIDLRAVRLAERHMKQISLDTPLLSAAPNDDNVTLAEFIADDPERGPDRAMEQEDFSETVRQAVRKSLKPREAKILILRFGLDEEEPLTSKSIAEVFELSEARVHQILTTSLDKLRKRQPELAMLM